MFNWQAYALNGNFTWTPLIIYDSNDLDFTDSPSDLFCAFLLLGLFSSVEVSGALLPFALGNFLLLEKEAGNFLPGIFLILAQFPKVYWRPFDPDSSSEALH